MYNSIIIIMLTIVGWGGGHRTRTVLITIIYNYRLFKVVKCPSTDYLLSAAAEALRLGNGFRFAIKTQQFNTSHHRDAVRRPPSDCSRPFRELKYRFVFTVYALHTMAGPPTFIELSREEQALELRSYLRSIGATLQEKATDNIEEDMKEIISKCDACLKTDLPDADIESFLCSIVSVIIGIGTMDVESNLVTAFSQKLSKYEEERFSNTILKTLWLLHGTVDPKLPARFQLYSDIVDVAKRNKQLLLVYGGIDSLKKSLLSISHSKKQKQSLLRQLHSALIENGHSELAAEVMIELLRNYTADDGKQAKDDAKRCIVSAIADPKTFLFEPLLSLTPVISLQNSPLHELLVIFVSGNLTNYLDFYKGHKDLIKSLALDHQANIHKMKLLTVMSLAEDSSIITFDTIQQQVQITAEQVEPFLLELFGTKFVRGRMDQAAKKVNISSTMYRTFSKQRWQMLRNSFFSWRSCLSVIEEGMKTVVSNSQTAM